MNYLKVKYFVQHIYYMTKIMKCMEYINKITSFPLPRMAEGINGAKSDVQTLI